jgi:eukaryotic-like serine/threonine-protein kinase
VSSPRADQTIEHVNAAIQSGRLASVPELLKVVQTIAHAESVLSVSELADLIKKDSAVLTRVIAVANSLGYNPSGIKIVTVFDAVHVLGFNCVRRLAMTLLLMEHAGRASSTAEQREMAATSLCSGLIAQVAAEQMTLLDPEEAFVCAALRNFGRLVLGVVMSEEFHEARLRAERDGNDDEVFRDVFGLTPLDLGYELLKSSTLPEPILNAIRDLPATALENVASGERQLAQLARFSLEMSQMALDPKIDASAFSAASFELMQRFSGALPALPGIFRDLLGRTEEQLRKMARGLGNDSLDRYGLDRLRSRARGSNLPSRPPTQATPTARVPSAAEPTAAPIEDACDMLERGGNRHNAMRLALNAMNTALAPRDVVHCALDVARGEFVLDHGYGPLTEALRGRVLFRRSERNVFLLCHARLENVVVRDATDPTLLPHLPAWLRGANAPKSFVLLPVQHQGRAHGVILIGWQDTQPTAIPPERLALIRKLLALVARTSVL